MLKKKELMQPSALQQIAAIEHSVIVAPYANNEKFVTVIARELSYVQIKSCGDFSLIETFQDKLLKNDKKETTFHEMVEYSELMHNVVKLSLLNPTYDQIINQILKYDNIDNIDKQLKDIKEMFLKLRKDHPEEKDEAEALQNEYARIELQYKYVLPDNFLNYIFCFALGIDSSDIKLVSEDMLYNAAVKAKFGNCNPCDRMPGMFSEFNKEDINERAWTIYFNRQEELKNSTPNKHGAK